MQIDLKKLREDINAERKKVKPGDPGISQSGLSMLLEGMGHEISQAQISRYEEDSSAITLELLEAWLRCLGTSLARELTRSPSPSSESLDFGDPYSKLRRRLEDLCEYLSSKAAAQTPEVQKVLEGLARRLLELRQKPTLLIAGMYDSGKTTVTNWLLGEENAFAESYSPTTSVITYIHHIADKPKWLGRNVVALFDENWSHEQRSSSVRPESCLHVGDLDTLVKLGTHTSDQRDQSARYASVFLDSPILQTCTLLDLPGYGHDDHDDASAMINDAVGSMDALLYLSSVNQFFNSADATYFQYLLDRLPVLSDQSGARSEPDNLFVLATHAHHGIDDEKLAQQIIEPAQAKLRKLFPLVEAESSNGALPDFSRRIFPFYREYPERNADLLSALKRCLVESLPEAVRFNVNGAVAGLGEEAVYELGQKLEAYREVAKVTGDQEPLPEIYRHWKESEKVVHATQRQALETLLLQMAQLRLQHEESFLERFDALINREYVEQFILNNYSEEKRKDGKKAAMQELPGMLLRTLDRDMYETLQQPLKELAILGREYMADMEQSVKISIAPDDSRFMTLPVDLKSMIVGGASAGATATTLSLWAASFGSLGGYAATATALGWFGLGGAGYMSGLAAIGGPVTLAVGLTAASYFMGKSLFGANWEKRLANQIVDHFEKPGESGKNLRGLMLARLRNDMWGETKAAAEESLSLVEKEYAAFLERLKSLAEGSRGDASLNDLISQLEEARDVARSLPWIPV